MLESLKKRFPSFRLRCYGLWVGQRGQGSRVSLLLGVLAATALLGCRPAGDYLQSVRSGEYDLAAGIEALREALASGASLSPSAPSLKKAIHRLQRATARRPEDPSGWANLGIAHYWKGAYPRAAEELQRAVDLASGEPRLWEWLARVHVATGGWNEARAALDEANRCTARHPRILNALAVVEYRAGQSDLASSYLAQALQANPEYAAALYNSAVLQQSVFRNAEKTRTCLERFVVVARSPALAATLVPSEIRALQERLRRVEAYLDPHGTRTSPGPTASGAPTGGSPGGVTAVVTVAEKPGPPVFLDSGTLTAAVPSTVQERLSAGYQAHRAGLWNQAIALYRSALEGDPKRVEAWYNLGLAYRAVGQKREAQQALLQAVRLAPGMAEAHYMLGVIAHEQGDTRQAIAHLDQALEVKPDYAHAHFVLGRLYREKGNAALARRHLEFYLQMGEDPRRVALAQQWIDALR